MMVKNIKEEGKIISEKIKFFFLDEAYSYGVVPSRHIVLTLPIRGLRPRHSMLICK